MDIDSEKEFKALKEEVEESRKYFATLGQNNLEEESLEHKHR